ncbi:4-hydroxy-tetrahydrodipicolinate reductase [Mycetocola manganoxydans]|uniref:4-hydroxy-tetrahydrodipicolinate reductase n=1 Tax=Mycetocola manganoxydans TaxID=699879 RepID=A0A3L6ZRR3_9MICO|nr:4-hydroxy-tetrahydrodipicolinate reductase [Mycetocola manganoxydans]RLP69782.1 4-hydroxy-tetrahydrodipicolinate reductase [Mycetocola manganoxydans]GHD50010.1 4-hydroxy-tetrahydrodipicolinate reductase [Mycetocola manganoxydans]
MVTSVAVVGANGTMGRLFTRLIDEAPGFEVTARLGSSSALTEMDGADIVVDVTAPAVSPHVVEHALNSGANVLVGTSGWSQERLSALRTRLADADNGAIIIPNFSLGSVLGTTLATIAGRFFDSIEIVEAHRAAKVDSPSGTAVRTAELIGQARAGLGPVEAPHVDQRARGQQVSSIPIHSLRLAGVVARQEVTFGGTGETLTITHNTVDGSSYEKGILLALEAARTATGLTVGLENLMDLGITRA